MLLGALVLLGEGREEQVEYSGAWDRQKGLDGRSKCGMADALREWSRPF